MNYFQSTFAALAVGALTVFGGCQTYDSTSVSNRDVGQISTVRTGTVLSVQEITIRPDGSIIGAATGAVLGGLGGSEIGGGDKAQTAGGIAGAVLGGIVGNEIGKAGNTKKGYSYVIKINETGDVKEITQGGDVYIQPGTPVSIIYRTSGVTLAPATYPTAPVTSSGNTAPVQPARPEYSSNQSGSNVYSGTSTARTYPASTSSTTTTTAPRSGSKSCKVVYPDGTEGPCTGEFARLGY